MKPSVVRKRNNLNPLQGPQVVITPPPERRSTTNRDAVSHLVLGTLGIGIVVSDFRGAITLANPAAKRLARGNPEGRLLSDAPNIWGDLFDASGRHLPVKEWPCMRALRGKTTVGRDCRLVRQDGDSSNVLFASCPLGRPGAKTGGSLSSLTDITVQKRKEMSLREDALLLDRARVAAEMHDTVLQGLTAIVLQLETLGGEFLKNPIQAGTKLPLVLETARQNLAEARRTMWVLSSETGGDQDPAHTLRFLAEKLFAGVPAELQMHLQECPQLNSKLRLALVRIGKEALTNALRHSRATKVRLELIYKRKEARLSVSDNGRGFVVAPFAPAQSGFGLLCLRMRAEQVGGRVSIRSRPGLGTGVVVSLPLAQASGVSHTASAR